eukprot:m.165841 g.165841  ORF g.165841 m.165841 type:complete len:1002 (+) comp31400_c0_seq4:183-3188(+)
MSDLEGTETNNMQQETEETTISNESETVTESKSELIVGSDHNSAEQSTTVESHNEQYEVEQPSEIEEPTASLVTQTGLNTDPAIADDVEVAAEQPLVSQQDDKPRQTVNVKEDNIEESLDTPPQIHQKLVEPPKKQRMEDFVATLDQPVPSDIGVGRSTRAKTFLQKIRSGKGKDMTLFADDQTIATPNAGKVVKKDFTNFDNAVEPENASWSSDWKARCCIRCGGRFRSLSLRRHNCQTCGIAVCANCSSKRLPRYPNLRICDLCFNDNLYTSKITISLRPKPHAIKTGTMSKRGHLSKGWKRRFFLLDSNGNLTYFNNNKEAGMIPIHNAQQLVNGCDVSQINWPGENSVKQGFAIVCVSRVYYVVCNSEESWWDWRRVISMVALLCFKCGRQCFPSNFQGADPNCTHLPEMNRLYHPECFRCDHKSKDTPHKCDLFSSAYQLGNKILCKGHFISESERIAEAIPPNDPLATASDVSTQDHGADVGINAKDQGDSYLELAPDDESSPGPQIPAPLTQKTVGKKQGRSLSTGFLGRLREEYAAATGEVHQLNDQLNDDVDDSDGEEEAEEEETQHLVRAKNRSRKKSLFNKANLKSQMGETLLKCVLRGIVESTKELTLGVDTHTGGSDLSAKTIKYLAKDETQHLMQQVKEKLITIDEAVRLAKLESMESGIPQIYTLDAEETEEDEEPKDPVEFEFVAFEPARFEEIRNACGVDAASYISSFETPPSGNLAGGNSGSFVKKSHDDHFIIKSIDQKESQVLLSILEKYLKHLQEFPNTLLVRFLGLYEAKIENRTISVIIMDNVLAKAGKLDIHELYDLKGSFIARRTMSSRNKVSATTEPQPNAKLVTQKDMDLVRPLIVGGRGKIILNMQMTEDVTFLNAQGLMDYSLLVGIHNCQPSCTECDGRRVQELSPDGKVRAADIHKYGVRGGGPPQKPVTAESVYFFGIIDLLQVWDGKKRMEKLAKTKVLGKDQHSISAVHPDEYAIRFLEMLTQRMVE